MSDLPFPAEHAGHGDAIDAARRRAQLEKRNMVVWFNSATNKYRVQPQEFPDQPEGWRKETVVTSPVTNG